MNQRIEHLLLAFALMTRLFQADCSTPARQTASTAREFLNSDPGLVHAAICSVLPPFACPVQYMSSIWREEILVMQQARQTHKLSSTSSEFARHNELAAAGPFQFEVSESGSQAALWIMFGEHAPSCKYVTTNEPSSNPPSMARVAEAKFSSFVLSQSFPCRLSAPWRL